MKSVLITFFLIFQFFNLSILIFPQGISSQTIGASNSIASSVTITTSTDSLENIFSGTPNLFFKYWYTLTITTDADIYMSSVSSFEPLKTFLLKSSESYTSIQRDAVLFDDYYIKSVSANANVRIILEGR